MTSHVRTIGGLSRRLVACSSGQNGQHSRSPRSARQSFQLVGIYSVSVKVSTVKKKSFGESRTKEMLTPRVLMRKVPSQWGLVQLAWLTSKWKRPVCYVWSRKSPTSSFVLKGKRKSDSRQANAVERGHAADQIWEASLVQEKRKKNKAWKRQWLFGVLRSRRKTSIVKLEEASMPRHQAEDLLNAAALKIQTRRTLCGWLTPRPKVLSVFLFSFHCLMRATRQGASCEKHMRRLVQDAMGDVRMSGVATGQKAACDDPNNRASSPGTYTLSHPHHVDSTPACTHACAHFPRAHMTFHWCFTDVWPKAKRFCAILKKSVISSSGLCWVSLLAVSNWLLHLLLVLCHNPQPRQHRWLEPEALASMEWSVWLHCQSDSGHRIWAQVLCRCLRRAHAGPHDCNATRAVTSEEPDAPRHSGTSSSKHTAAASRVPTELGSSGIASGNSWRIMSRLTVETASGKLVRTLRDRFSTLSSMNKREERWRSKRCAIVNRQWNYP